MKNYKWKIPKYSVKEYKKKKNRYCLCIPIINEGEKIINQLNEIKSLRISDSIDIILCDGGSTDGSTEDKIMIENDVNYLLIKNDIGKLSAQLRMGYSFAIEMGYDGIITVDGNGKDSLKSIYSFISCLDDGWDFVQGSRYLPGGEAINTPLIRHIAVRLLHAPIISLAAKFKYTDTTNGYRAYSVKFLLDERVKPFRDVFDSYELLAYLSVRAPELNFRTKEIPVTRKYPKVGKIPTKISFFKGNFLLLKILFNILMNKYDPKD
ncbi:glycosyltransferase family 2 protein [Peptoanaerobacter stomatis]|jgi:hypothetical protein